MKLGVSIYFDKINAQGGIDGHPLDLKVLDDSYDPARAASNDRQLIDQDHVLALIGNNGTPTAVVTRPIVDEKKVLLFAPHTGASFLRPTPPDRYIINLRTSYSGETEALVKGLLSIGIKPDEFAFFTQNDAYGDSVYQGAVKALKEAGFDNPETLPYGRYQRASENIIGALGTIVQGAKKTPKVFIMGGINGPNTKFVNMAIKQFPNALFVTVSGLIDAKDLDKSAEGKVIVSQVVPPYSLNLPIIKEYFADLAKYGGGEEPSYASLEGYVAAKLFVIGLKQAVATKHLTREGIIDSLETLHNVDIGIGVPITLDKNDHTALHQNWLTIFKDGKFVPFSWSELKKR